MTLKPVATETIALYDYCQDSLSVVTSDGSG